MLHAPCHSLAQKQLLDSGPGRAGRFTGQRAAEQQRGNDAREKDACSERRHNQEPHHETRTPPADDV